MGGNGRVNVGKWRGIVMVWLAQKDLPLGPLGAQIRPGWVVSIFKNFPKIDIWAFFGSKMVKQKVEIEGAGPPWRDSQRNSAPGRGPQVPNGATATHLVTKRSDLGSLGVPGPASTPLIQVWRG